MATTRELYQKKYDAQISQWEAKIASMKASSAKAAAQAQLDLKPHLDAVETKYQAAKTRFQELTAATEDKVADGTKAVDHAWGELRAAIEGGLDAIKKHVPS